VIPVGFAGPEALPEDNLARSCGPSREALARTQPRYLFLARLMQAFLFLVALRLRPRYLLLHLTTALARFRALALGVIEGFGPAALAQG
jgi:hypothetical protein